MGSLTASEAAEQLGVSSATVRNWFRAGHLTPATTHPLSFAEAEVLALKERIRTNRFNKLRSRANKTASEKLAGKDAAGNETPQAVTEAVHFVSASGLDPSASLFAAALYRLEDRDEVSLPAGGGPLEPSKLSWRRPTLGAVMTEWRRHITAPIPGNTRSHFTFLNSLEDTADPLGTLYQGLSSVGKMSRAGAFFTPWNVIEESLATLEETAAPTSFLDPCCGTGRFLLLAAARFAIDVDKLAGFDSDPVSVGIARLNLLLRHRDIKHMPRVHCLDSLNELANGRPDCSTNGLLGAVDAIATNPPWGSCKNKARHKTRADFAGSGESFSLFLEKSLRLLREGGRLSFILPESILQIKAHTSIRRLLAEETCISRITLLGRVFSGVFTPIIRLDLEKKPPPSEWKVEVRRRGDTHFCPQQRFRGNIGHTFDVEMTPRDEELLNKIYRLEHNTLRHNADWALGIVTGDNGRCVLAEPVPGSEPVLRGRDLFKFAPRAPQCHIMFRPERFQQVAPERYYRAPEKLIYRFVSDRLVFAYDNTGTLTLNSANILIPRIPGMSIKSVLAFLNSRVFQYIFVKRFHTRKVLKSDLETLPFPILSANRLDEADRRVDICMNGEYEPARALNEFVYELFSLNGDDIGVIEEALKAENLLGYV